MVTVMRVVPEQPPIMADMSLMMVKTQENGEDRRVFLTAFSRCQKDWFLVPRSCAYSENQIDSAMPGPITAGAHSILLQISILIEAYA